MKRLKEIICSGRLTISGLLLVLQTLAFGFAVAASVFAQTSGFTYQGKLNENGTPASANYDMRFKLFDAAAAGNLVGSKTQTNVPTVGGIFTVELDFGTTPFNDGSDRWLEISISPAGQNNYTTLAPRQKLTSAPYSIQSLKAATADNSFQLGGIAADQYVQTSDARLSDARLPLPGSNDYIQNSNTAQPTVNFNIGGRGTADRFNAASYFEINGSKVLSAPGTNNFFGGVNAGIALTTGVSNAFFGFAAGQKNTDGGNNVFFGSNSGENNLGGSGNSFVGYLAGSANTTGGVNSFLGFQSGFKNTTGSSNVFVGRLAGYENLTGTANVFVGDATGVGNTSGMFNTAVGAFANITAPNLQYATAIGADATVSLSNTVVLGRTADRVTIPGILNVRNIASPDNFVIQFKGEDIIKSQSYVNGDSIFVGLGAGASNTTGDRNVFMGDSAGGNNTTGNLNVFFGNAAGSNNETGYINSFFGSRTGSANTTGFQNTFLGTDAGRNNTTGSNNIFIGVNTGVANAGTQVDNSIVIGNGLGISTSNTIALGNVAQTTIFPGRVIMQAGTANPNTSNGTAATFSVGFSGLIAQNLIFRRLGADILGSPVHLCIRSVSVGGDGGWGLTSCTTSFASRENKIDAQPFAGGLDIIKQLNPIRFKWKADGAPDFGLNAEDVAEVEPNLVTRGEDGKIEDLKKGSLDVLFINAFKEQQKQIEAQQRQIDALKKLVCQLNPQTEVCKE